ncbi:MAG: Bug family tripartite tricarboxylate transporter substrate binding protein [Xanthobacteraceae bacterium]
MMHKIETWSARALLALVTAALPLCDAQAQQTPYPTHQVRVIVPYPPGGPTDVIARLIAQKLTEGLGQSFYVENLTGASGAVGSSTAAKAPGDGHTLLFTTNDFAVASVTNSQLGYDPVKNFAPITIVSASPQVVVAHPAQPVRTLKELAELAKAQPGQLSYASMSIGFGQLTAERLVRMGLKVDMVRVPFQGAAPLINSTVGGHTPFAFIGLPPAIPLIKEGKLRALAVVSARRSPDLPDVPTLAEQGILEQEADLLIGAVAPAGTPRPIVDLLQRKIAELVRTDEVKQRLDTLGFTAVASTPDAYAAQIKNDIETWSRVVKELGIKVD